MPSQEPPLDAKSEEVDLPPDDTEDTDGSKKLNLFFPFFSRKYNNVVIFFLSSIKSMFGLNRWA